MEEPKEEWRIQQYRAEGNEGRISWILNKSLGLGKKIFLSGLVISSAPLVLPPLLVISAIGFVVSLPSGIFLASYACSEKLMSKLLPMPESEDELEEEEEKITDEDIHRGVKRKIESVEGVKNDDVLGDKDVAVEENGHEEDVSEDSLDVEKEKDKENVVVSKEEVPLVDESGKEEPVIVQGVVLDVTEGGEENGEATVEVTTIVIEENGGQERENGVSEEEMKRETKSLIEEIKDERKADNVEKTSQETSKGDQNAGATELPVSHRAKETKDAGVSSEKEVQTTPSNEAKKKKNVKKKQPPPQQQKVVYSEEKIWGQIEGLRKIVGYKATIQKTSIEELKALYIFTGVEPPASFKEPSDLAEVVDKLQFLKSIIGVS
ncbi:hypothetical protein L484_015100 [Morus notabilis]|uniref:Uncharacterized protein n=1 Tax=Morus notabilis TaxID=981085 RepID=W9S6Y4_9ROSA|nr:hypothetical protein L484_015100 [Morus notabilis]